MLVNGSVRNGGWLQNIARETDFVERHVSAERMNLIASLVALSSVFWASVTAVETESYRFDNVVQIAPYFVGVIWFGMAMQSLRGVYHRLAFPVEETNQSEEELFNPSNLVDIAIGLVGVGSCTLVILKISDIGLAGFALFSTVFGYSMIVCGLRVFSSVNTGEVTNRYTKRLMLLDPREWSRYCFVAFYFYFFVGFITLAMSWYLAGELRYFTFGVLSYMMMAFIGLSFEKYGELTNSSWMLGVLKSIEHWIVGANPPNEEIKQVFTAIFSEGKIPDRKMAENTASLIKMIEKDW